MKKLITLIGLFLIAVSGFADDRERSAQLAQENYEKGNYLEAIKHYESIASQGYESFDLYYNLGNAYFKANSIPQALLNYERAKRINPLDEDLKFNIELANSYLVDKIDALPELGITSWFKSFVLSLSAGAWGTISLLLFLVILGLVLVYFFVVNYKKIALIAAPIVLVIFTFTFVMASKAKTYSTAHNSAIVFSPSVTVKSVPGTAGSDLFIIHSGLKVKILETQSEWSKIKLPDGNIGWLKNQEIEVI